MTFSGESSPAPLRRYAIWVFVGALIWQALVLTRFSQSPHFLPSGDDMKFYNDWALRIAGGTWSDGMAFYGLPGYAYALAAIYSVVGFDPFVVGALQALMFAGVAAVIFLMGARLHGGPGGMAIGLMGAIGWTLCVPAQTFSVILMPTVWQILAYWALVLWLSEPVPRSTWKPWLTIGLVVGAVATLVATILFIIPLALVAIIRSVGTGESRLRKFLPWACAGVVLILGVAVGTSPAWLHNYFVAKEPVVLSAHSGINLWIGNNPVANGYPKIPPGLRASQDGLLRDSITLAEEAAGRPLERYEVSSYWSDKAKEWIRSNRFAWMRLLRIKVENFFNALQYDDVSTITLLQTSGVIWPGFKFGLIAALGVPGLLVAAWRVPRARWIAAAVGVHLLALLPVFVTERYRLASVPGLLVGVGYGLYQLYQTIQAQRWGAAARWLGVGAAAVALVTIPRGDWGVWSLDHYKAGIRALELGELERAQVELETAYAYAPTGPEISFALGNFWYTKRNFPQAKAFYRDALKLDPTHAGAYNNLGVIMIEEARWGRAERFLRRAIALEPDDAKSHYLLARALMEAGRFDEADATVSEALRLRPEQREFLELRERIGVRLRN